MDVYLIIFDSKMTSDIKFKSKTMKGESLTKSNFEYVEIKVVEKEYVQPPPVPKNPTKYITSKPPPPIVNPYQYFPKPLIQPLANQPSADLPMQPNMVRRSAVIQQPIKP